MIRTVLFDLGNVLFHFSHQKMCAQIAAVCGEEEHVITQRLLDSGLLAAFEQGSISEQQFYEQLTNHRTSPSGRQAAAHQAAVQQAGSDIFSFNDPMQNILESLQQQNIRLVLLSNTNRWHYEWICNRYHCLQQFDAVVTSFEVQASKPEPAIFEAALNVIDCQPGECFYTDDILEYVEVGRQFGLHAEQFTNAATLRDQLAAHNLQCSSPNGESL